MSAATLHVNRPTHQQTMEPDQAERGITIRLNGKALEGELVVPHAARGIVIFAHGSGSSRFSPRNRAVAHALHKRRLATLLFDLLTAEEEEIDQIGGSLRFDLPLLAERLAKATTWVQHEPLTKSLLIGYFGASTGAAAALMAAASHPEMIAAIVSRGGRPDLAGGALPLVKAPTLLIVGGRDTEVIALNEEAMAQLPAIKALEIVPDATHLFEELGALEEVARLAGRWFERYLG